MPTERYPVAMGLPNVDVFAVTLCELAEYDRNLLVVTSDSRGSGRLAPFAARYPQQLIEVGIAEQTLVGVAAGLAASGKRVFAVSPSCFLTARALEQIKNDVAYSDNPVVLVGISAGVSYGALGSTHHSTHDLAALQAIHNIAIVVPADNYETREAVLAASRCSEPVYLRFGKKAMPVRLGGEGNLVFGHSLRLTPARAAYDVALIACGEMALPALAAAYQMGAWELSCCVLSVPYIRPLDELAILDAARHSRVVITVEEHSVHGGLGSRVAGLLMQQAVFRPMQIAGFPDEPTITGSQAELFHYYELDAEGLALRALALLGKQPAEDQR
ncbi:MAG: transketolase family protein [Anaerolineae bacterium]